MGVQSLVRKNPWSRKWQPIPVFLPGKFYGQRNLVDYSPEDHKSPIRLSVRAYSCVCVCVLTQSVMSRSLWLHVLQPTSLLSLWDSSGKNPGTRCLFLLKRSFQLRDRTCISCMSYLGRQVLYLQCHITGIGLACVCVIYLVIQCTVFAEHPYFRVPILSCLLSCSSNSA